MPQLPEGCYCHAEALHATARTESHEHNEQHERLCNVTSSFAAAVSIITASTYTSENATVSSTTTCLILPTTSATTVETTAVEDLNT
eukprot:20693-Heterococcus_DN1.PRE.2